MTNGDLIGRLNEAQPRSLVEAELLGEVVHAIEAADARIEALEAALRPFADMDGEGSEDFPDNTKVTVTFGRTTHYALRLSDIRRASQTLDGTGG